MRLKTLLVGGLMGLMGLMSSPALAASDLTIVDEAGTISVLDRSGLAGLEQVVIVTGNEHVDGEATFKGPLARDVLAAGGLAGITEVVLTAANDYAITVPVADFMEYDVLFATEMNGRRLSLRDKGPVWVIYPMSQHAELQSPIYNSRLIWQLVRVEGK